MTDAIFQASSLEDIAKHFDQQAKNCRIVASHERDLREANVQLNCAVIWELAANSIRHTKLVQIEKVEI